MRELEGRLERSALRTRQYREALTALRSESGCRPSGAAGGGGGGGGTNGGHRGQVQTNNNNERNDGVPLLQGMLQAVGDVSVGDTVQGKGPERGGNRGGASPPLTSPADREEQRLQDALASARREREEVRRKRELLALTVERLDACRVEMERKVGHAEAAREAAREEFDSLEGRNGLLAARLEALMHLHSLGDCFHIWHQGPYATINGFRLGRLSGQNTVGWFEVNAALGQAALVLTAASKQMGLTHTKYLVVPLGSYSKIARKEDKRILYNLYQEESFSIFPKRNFNNALKAFLHCLYETGEFVGRHDPTLSLPYAINDSTDTINNLPVALLHSPEDWTKAMKYVASNLKFIVAWASKHSAPKLHL